MPPSSFLLEASVLGGRIGLRYSWPAPLLAAGWGHISGDLGTLSSFLCCHVSSLIALYFNMAWYPVEPHSPLLCSKALKTTQDGGDEAYVVTALQLWKGLWSHTGV